MALSRKSQARRVAEAHSAAPAAMLATEDAVGADHARVADVENAEASMLQDIDAILSRIDNRIAKQRKEMDDLLERIRQPAA
jgi:hypothetical protein